MIDINTQETQEWLDSLEAVIEHEGEERAAFLVQQLVANLSEKGTGLPDVTHTAYINTIAPENEVEYPGDRALEKRIQAFIRWNSVVMVLRAGKKAAELGGHIASYASSSTLYEVGFNHFYKAQNSPHGSDLVFFQGHASPGIYARSYLEGRFNDEQLDHFRQEIDKPGLSSYPHSWLMPDYWQFATVSMGLGPLQAIYQARFLKYLQNRGLTQQKNRKVWCYCGDGEMDEPESLGAISVAAREKLDNLIFVINCNLQRLDGPVRGNTKIIQELEGFFKGAGWKVIKVVWGRRWDPLLAADDEGLLKTRMQEACDGDYQNYKAFGGAYTRDEFFGQSPELKKMVEHLSDDEIAYLNRGGHDAFKVYNAYYQAVNTQDKPVVILAKTVKGFGMGEAGEAQNITHQQKKMDIASLKAFRDRFNIPVDDENIDKLPFYRPDASSPEMQYLLKQREKLGGFIPTRETTDEKLTLPALEAFKPLLEGSKEREISTTMAFVRLFNILLKDKNIKSRLVPIIPDEARTFGMEGLFRQIGIYSPLGQRYKPMDADQIMSYKEDVKGQLLEEGINEAGAFASWLAAATSYSTNKLTMIPFYIYYSMFGFQRVGDLAWAAGDMRAKGFLLGGTAGRTTLAGEGLQHQDGHSHLLSSTIPNCRSYDPAFSYELAVIVQHGLKAMYEENRSEYYYITVMNENYRHPAMPKGVEDDIIQGIYLLKKAQNSADCQLMGAGTILREVMNAAVILEKDYGINANVFSVTSFSELRREGLEKERFNRLNPLKAAKVPFITKKLKSLKGPVIAASDYMKIVAEQIRQFIPQQYVTLGTDGFGRSDTRNALREHFEVNANHIVVATLKALVDEGKFDAKRLSDIIKTLNIDPARACPSTR